MSSTREGGASIGARAFLLRVGTPDARGELISGQARGKEILELRDYELVAIISPEVTEENVGVVADRIGQWIVTAGGEVTNVSVWGRRRLAYPINDFREGTYVTTEFRMNSRATGELERNLKLSEDVLRHLLMRVGE